MKEALRAHLIAAVAPVPVDWGWNAQGEPAPRIVLGVVSGDTDYHMAGPSGYRRNRVQVDCYAVSYRPAQELAAQVRAALSGWQAGAISGAFEIGERDLPPDTSAGEVLARISLDYMIHHQEG